MKKRIVALLSAMVVLCGSLGVFAITTGAATTSPQLSIDYCNLSFRNNLCIKYAVKTDASDVKVLIWTEPQSEYVVGTQDDEIVTSYSETINGTSYNIFDYTEIVAKQMTDVFYARAYVEVDGVNYYSDINKYSVLQYAYNKLGKTATASTDEELKEMLTHMLEYGAGAQKYLDDYKIDRLATDDWYQVKVDGGVLDDGCTHGLYLPGEKVIMTATDTDADGATFAYWADSNGNQIGTTATYELTVGSKNEIYTPVYVKYSDGLEFDSNGDGTCYIIGMGTCTDTDLVIPAVSPDGDTVIGIDSSAFAGEALTSVSIPNTLEEIGRRAFNGCTDLTDVYYDGTEEEWNNISISTGNDPLDAATKHFNEPVVESYTVTFVDYNGTVLKTETVKSGESATAPADPSRDGYTFVGWDKDFSNITGNMTVTATYEEISTGEPTIVVKNVTASAGDKVQVSVSLKNNPGILGMTLRLTYDESAMTLTNVARGTALSEMTNFTLPRDLGSGCQFPWAAECVLPEDATNGEILILTFTISDSAVAGKYEINMTYDNGAIIDNDLMPVSVEIQNGSITIN